MTKKEKIIYTLEDVDGVDEGEYREFTTERPGWAIGFLDRYYAPKHVIVQDVQPVEQEEL